MDFRRLFRDDPSNSVACDPFKNEMTINLNRAELREMRITHWIPFDVPPNVDLNRLAICVCDGDVCWELADLVEFILEKLKPTIPKTFCFHCFREFEDEINLAEHLKEEKVSVPENFKSYTKGVELPLMFQYDEKPEEFQCYICNKKAKDDSRYQQHLCVYERWEIPYKCTECPFLATHYRFFLEHLKHEHPALVFCPLCFEKLELGGLSVNWINLSRSQKDRMFSQVITVYHHVKGHLAARHQYGCDKCVAFFIDPDRLKRHAAEQHLPPPPSTGKGKKEEKQSK